MRGIDSAHFCVSLFVSSGLAEDKRHRACVHAAVALTLPVLSTATYRDKNVSRTCADHSMHVCMRACITVRRLCTTVSTFLLCYFVCFFQNICGVLDSSNMYPCRGLLNI